MAAAFAIAMPPPFTLIYAIITPCRQLATHCAAAIIFAGALIAAPLRCQRHLLHDITPAPAIAIIFAPFRLTRRRQTAISPFFTPPRLSPLYAAFAGHFRYAFTALMIAHFRHYLVFERWLPYADYASPRQPLSLAAFITPLAFIADTPLSLLR